MSLCRQVSFRKYQSGCLSESDEWGWCSVPATTADTESRCLYCLAVASLPREVTICKWSWSLSKRLLKTRSLSKHICEPEPHRAGSQGMIPAQTRQVLLASPPLGTTSCKGLPAQRSLLGQGKHLYFRGYSEFCPPNYCRSSCWQKELLRESSTGVWEMSLERLRGWFALCDKWTTSDWLCRRGTAGVTGDTGFERWNPLSVKEMNSEGYFAVAEKAQIVFLHLGLHVVKIGKERRKMKMDAWLKWDAIGWEQIRLFF